MSALDVLKIRGLKPILFTVFMGTFGFSVVLPILPFYLMEAGGKTYEMGMLTAIYAIANLVAAPFMGRMADKWGRKKVILLGISCSIIAYLIYAFSFTVEHAFIARALGGIGYACVLPSCISLISDYTTKEQRGMAMGFFGMSMSLGIILGPAAGGLISAYNMRDAFFLSELLVLANFLFVYLFVSEPQHKIEEEKVANTDRGISPWVYIASPLIFIFIGAAFTTSLMGGLDATLALFCGQQLGFDSTQVGLLFTLVGVVTIAAQFVSGNLINRFGEPHLIKFGLFLSGTGFLLLVFAGGWLTLIIPLGILATGNALTTPSVNSLLTKKVSGERGLALGISASFTAVGLAGGPLLAGFLYSMNPTWGFIGLGLITWTYALIFAFIGAKKLEKFNLG
jgi:MFS family permease